MDISQRVRKLRAEHGHTLKSLGAKAGLSIPYLSDIEHGRANPTLNTLISLANAFDMSLLDMLRGVDMVGEESEPALAPGLAELLDDPRFGPLIDADWLALLNHIQLRGKRPQTMEQWLEIFLHLRRMLGD